MKIALMMENSQAGKNATILAQLNAAVEPFNHDVFNVGMDDENDHHLTYIHLGIMASLLLNSNSVDFCSFWLWNRAGRHDVVKCSSRRGMWLLFRAIRRVSF